MNEILVLPAGPLTDASLAIAHASESQAILDHSIRSFLFARLLVSCALNRSDKSRLGVWREQEGPRLNWC